MKLREGTEANQLELLAKDIAIRPHGEMRGGIVYSGIVVTINRYNLEDLLCQMLEDYGEDELVKRIKALD